MSARSLVRQPGRREWMSVHTVLIWFSAAGGQADTTCFLARCLKSTHLCLDHATQGTTKAVLRIAASLTPAILSRSRTVAACAVR